MNAPRRARTLPMVPAALAALALLLAGGCAPDKQTEFLVYATSGYRDLSGSWSTCIDNGDETYTLRLWTFTYNELNFAEFTALEQATCGDAADSTTSYTALLSTPESKNVSFSADGTTADASAPSPLAQPLDVSTSRGSVTVTSDATALPVLTEFYKLLYVDDFNSPYRLYMENGASTQDADGNYDFLDSAVYYEKQ